MKQMMPKAKIDGTFLVRKVNREFHFFKRFGGWNITNEEMESAIRGGATNFQVIESPTKTKTASLKLFFEKGIRHKTQGVEQICLPEKYFDSTDINQQDFMNEAQGPKSMAHINPKMLPPTVCIFTAIWNYQKKLFNALGGWLTGQNKYQQTLSLTRPLMHEVLELESQMEAYWKGWKKSAKQPDDHEIKMEIVDCMHFLVQISQLHFKSPQDFYEFYIAKHKENCDRISRRY